MSEPRHELNEAYAEFGPMVRAYALSRLGNLHDADEVLQETFLAVARNLSDLRRATMQKAWLIGIARNVIRNRRRAAAVRRTQPLDHNMAAISKHNDDARLDDMRCAIERLPEALRETLELRLTHELSYAEIATALEIPIGTVRSRIHTAVVALKEWAEGHVERRVATAPR